MAGYIKDAESIVDSIDHYCTYGAQNWDKEADHYLADLYALLQKANREQSGIKDVPLLLAMYKEQKRKIEDLKAESGTAKLESK